MEEEWRFLEINPHLKYHLPKQSFLHPLSLILTLIESFQESSIAQLDEATNLKEQYIMNGTYMW